VAVQETGYTFAYSTTESKLYAATEISKYIKWLSILMAGVGLPYCTAIVVGEDNEVTHQIGHAGKVTHNVRRVVIQTAALQNDIASMKLAHRHVGSSGNRSDRFTKLLQVVPFWTHTNAYRNAPTKKHIYTIAGPEFGSTNLSRPVLIVHALYGLKSSGAWWRDHMTQTLRDDGFQSCLADPGVWMKSRVKPDGDKYWE
jgi:hypothetical protein